MPPGGVGAAVLVFGSVDVRTRPWRLCHRVVLIALGWQLGPVSFPAGGIGIPDGLHVGDEIRLSQTAPQGTAAKNSGLSFSPSCSLRGQGMSIIQGCPSRGAAWVDKRSNCCMWPAQSSPVRKDGRSGIMRPTLAPVVSSQPLLPQCHHPCHRSARHWGIRAASCSGDAPNVRRDIRSQRRLGTRAGNVGTKLEPRELDGRDPSEMPPSCCRIWPTRACSSSGSDDPDVTANLCPQLLAARALLSDLRASNQA